MKEVAPIQQGILLKRSDYVKVWRERYFVLTANPPQLCYYIGKERRPKNVYDLRAFLVEDLPFDAKEFPKRTGFLLKTSGAELALSSDNANDIIAWRKALASLEKSSPVKAAAIDVAGARRRSDSGLAPHGIPQSRSFSADDSQAASKAHKLAGAQSEMKAKDVSLAKSVSQLTVMQDATLQTHYSDQQDIFDAVQSGILVVTFPKTRGSTSITVSLPLNSVSTSGRVCTIVGGSLVLDGIRCSFEGNFQLDTLHGRAVLKPVW